MLVVDDDEGYRMLLTDAISDAGFNVIAAKNGEEALQKISQNPDLIMLDYVLPDTTGIDILKKIRAQNSTWAQKVPVFMLTQKSDLSTIADAMEGHVSGYFVKSEEALDSMVAEVRQKLGV
ncbi:MAG: hypothetical protein A2787_04935 [Omnitrophica WOR_2 bacterium RIFCSPHIGHO2_01_FULL_48_9]|nr:MAG: hypothetical protein A3D10_04840 [Omnitrophica WOR_2 bacterium RIFCSPHIGHO2_02_FULL_48_11]OGX31422.1 MAG: hypothetical protein A2787_04935 [Omnitrophica WOR_2 bacterium RIFCSPHIGHO2_01_FULL_48_9]